MTLSRDDAIGFGRAALTLLDIDGEVDVLDPDPFDDHDVIQVRLGNDDWAEEVHLPVEPDRTEAVWQIADQISEYISESRQYWGQQFPRCPGHVHPAAYAADDDAIWLRCPETGAEFRRVTV